MIETTIGCLMLAILALLGWVMWDVNKAIARALKSMQDERPE